MLEFSRRAYNAKHAIIVIGTDATLPARAAMKVKFPDLLVYDIGTLAFLVSKHTSLIHTFEDITREVFIFSDTVEPKPVEIDIEADISRPIPPAVSPLITAESKGRGAFARKFAQFQLGEITPKHLKKRSLRLCNISSTRTSRHGRRRRPAIQSSPFMTSSPE